MADPEEYRAKRSKHDEHMSRVFDEVMGLGQFADSSHGSASSSRSSGQEERSQGEEERKTRGGEESPGQGDGREGGEEDSNGSGREERMEEGEGEASLPRLASPSLDRHSPFTVETSGGGEAGSGGAALDDDLDALPVYGADEEEDEDWHYALPIETADDADANKTDRKSRQSESRNRDAQEDPFTSLPAEKEQEKEGERGGSIASADTSHSSQDPENSQDGVLERSGVMENSQQGERRDLTAVQDSAPPMPPIVNIKDEPIDEGYDSALLPHSSIKHIKEELEHQEEELRISSVYSVRGENAFTPPTVPPPVPPPVQAPAPQPAAIFIPGKNGLVQPSAVATLPLRPLAPVPALAPLPQPPPPQPPAQGTAVRCSGCSKILLKGQTAFQRKGSTQLFCSTVCLTGYLPPTSKARSCYQCLKEITQPKDMIMTPIDSTNYMHFCSQFCLTVFNRKKKPEQKPPEKPSCSVCRVMNKIEHEVLHQGRVHRLCSDACFLTWRKTRQLAMNCCEGCGLYCKSSSASCQTLSIDKSQLSFCSATCISTYKRTCSKTAQCANCHITAPVCSTIMERDQKGKVQLYCSALCVEHSRPPKHTLTGTPFPCSLCKKNAVPQYHLAMVDGSIRNFCSLDCVTTYRKSGPTSQPEPDRDLTNGTSSSTPRDPFHRDVPRPSPSAGAGPYGQSPHPSQPSKASSSVPPIPQDFSSPLPYPGHHPGHTSVPPLVPPSYPPLPPPSAPDQGLPRAPLPSLLHPKPGQPGGNEVFKLTCHQCTKQFSTKPQLFSHQGRISMFCGKACSEQYKVQRNIVAPCAHCHLEKIIYDFITFNQQDHAVCSPSCKLLFKDELAHGNRELPWRPCGYCSSIAQKTLHSHYSGKMEEFCRPDCMSQYTVLFYGMARCDSCRKQGDMTEKLQCSGSVRNFCSLPCLLQFCHQHFESSQHSASNGTGTGPALPTPYGAAQPHHSKINPVIATDAVSLDSGSASQPHVTADSALTGSLPTSNTHDKNLDNASTQTDAMRVPVARRRQMKNKSVLCRPFTLDQETLCQLPQSDTDPPTAVSTVTPAQLASPSRPADPPTEQPSPSPEPQRDTEPCHSLPARLTGRHFLGKREQSKTDCVVCSHHKRKKVVEEEEDGKRKRVVEEDGERKRGKMEEAEGERKRGGMEEDQEDKKNEEAEEMGSDNEEVEREEERRHAGKEKSTERRETVYYCKTCPAEPSLCPAPCFELYHTKLLYKMATELDTLGVSLVSSVGEEKVRTGVSLVSSVGEEKVRTGVSLVSSVGEEKVRTVFVPVPVPVFVPVPMNMYSQHTPVAMVMPMPVPVPMVIPSQNKEMKDAAVQSEPLAEEEVEKAMPVSHGDQGSTYSGGIESEAVTPLSWEDESAHGEERMEIAHPPLIPHKDRRTESDHSPMTTHREGGTVASKPLITTEPEGGTGTSTLPSTELQLPSSPVMDLEADFPLELCDQKSSVPSRGVKRPREEFSSRKRGRRRTGSVDRSSLLSPSSSKLIHQYGVKAWRNWVRHRNTEPLDSLSVCMKEDLLQCDSTELSYGLCHFIREVRRPNGDTYTPDSIFYLCLGIQQYLFEKGRIENIFTDELYGDFTAEITGMLQQWKPTFLLSGCKVLSRVEECYLWECKQLGAYSPAVLLNTLLFFCTRAFRFTTLEQHRRLAFTNLTHLSRPCSRTGKAHYLRYRASRATTADRDHTDWSLRTSEGDLEMPENIVNPLHCPVRLYEFYLSRCPETVKRREDVFYLQPEQTVHPNSLRWYTSQPLESSTLQSMLTRILAVREVHQEQEAAQQQISSSTASTDDDSSQ